MALAQSAGRGEGRHGGVVVHVETCVESAWFQQLELKYNKGNCFQVMLSISNKLRTGVKAEAWFLLIHADASLSLAWFQQLELKYDKLLSSVAFNVK